MPSYLLPTPHPLRSPAPDPTDVSGEDVAFTDGLVIVAGDWKTVRGDDAAEQSVRREATANQGGLVRRPDWGIGATDAVFRAMNKTTSDALIARARRRLAANPRVGRVVDVSTLALDNAQGTALRIEYVPAGRERPTVTTLKAKR